MSGGLGVLTVRSAHLNESTFIRSAGTISALSAHARGAVFYPLSKRGGGNGWTGVELTSGFKHNIHSIKAVAATSTKSESMRNQRGSQLN